MLPGMLYGAVGWSYHQIHHGLQIVESDSGRREWLLWLLCRGIGGGICAGTCSSHNRWYIVARWGRLLDMELRASVSTACRSSIESARDLGGWITLIDCVR